MTNAVERLVNLTLFLAASRGSVTAEHIRSSVVGYPADSDEVAFKRMLERDKDTLRAAGLVIHSDDLGKYRLDPAATYVAPFTLEPEKAALVRAVALTMLEDPSFPFASDLRIALLKISAEIDLDAAPSAPATPAGSTLADEDPERQGSLVSQIASAAATRKRISFGYTNSLGSSAPHSIEPYGLFLHDGRWYTVGRDADKDEVRTYSVTRMTDLVVNSAAPKTPDFERPEDFDLSSFIRLPFQYGREADGFAAVLEFDAASAWKAERVTAGHGSLAPQPDGSLRWEVDARSLPGLLRFVIENGPGLKLIEPTSALGELRQALAEVETQHG